jgi:ABC-2 type transport system permease protein
MLNAPFLKPIAFLRLEIAEARRSRWLAFTGATYAVLVLAFVAFGLRESTVLGFTGMSRAILNVSNAVLVAVPLVCLVGTSQAIVRGRAGGAFELLLSQPCRREDWFAGLVLSRLAVLVGPLVALLAAATVAGALGDRDAALAPTVARCLAVAVALAWAFTGIGVLVSSFARTAERALVYALLTWLVAVALHDFALVGVLLRWDVPAPVVFALAAVNPVEGARLGLLSGVDPDLAVLGPVGFWIATRLGPARTIAAAIAWPAVVGAASFWLARWRFRRSDLV